MTDVITKIRLNFSERAILNELPVKGGMASHTNMLLEVLHDDTLYMTDFLIGKTMRHIGEMGKGGYQDALRNVFARSFLIMLARETQAKTKDLIG